MGVEFNTSFSKTSFLNEKSTKNSTSSEDKRQNFDEFLALNKGSVDEIISAINEQNDTNLSLDDYALSFVMGDYDNLFAKLKDKFSNNFGENSKLEKAEKLARSKLKIRMIENQDQNINQALQNGTYEFINLRNGLAEHQNATKQTLQNSDFIALSNLKKTQSFNQNDILSKILQRLNQ